jgi:carbon-monoxide dehydrogenase large subunit
MRPPYAFGCHIVEVEVDVETGLVTILRYSVAHDCGVILNPMIVNGQIDGGVVHGISNALYERIVYSDDGQPLTTTFMDFRIPTAVEAPVIDKVHTVTPATENPIGAKGAGEGGTLPAMAAIASAVEDALADLDVHIDRYPLIPSILRDLIIAKEQAT